MTKALKKDLDVLVEAQVITVDAAAKIRAFYAEKGGHTRNRLVVMFGILGALLMGLGVILIIAHNWDEFSKTTKTVFAFLPLVAGQAVCGYTLIKRAESAAWRESAATFLFFAVGASISLVSQVYNISGDLEAFVLTWSLLCLPLTYLMRSSMVSLLYITGISWYAVLAGWSFRGAHEPYWYWPMFLAALPHYYLLYKRQPAGNFMTFHNWAVPVSLLFTLSTVADKVEELIFPAYVCMLGIFYLVGAHQFFDGQKQRNNGYLAIGTLGTAYLLLSFSFDWLWKDLQRHSYGWDDLAGTPESMAFVVLALIAGGMLLRYFKAHPPKDLMPTGFVFLLFIPTFFIGMAYPSAAIVAVNLMALALGLLTIKRGADQENLGIMNYGLIIITALIVCRFFDSDISFVTRGILFLVLGFGFFFANYRMLNRRKSRSDEA